MRRTTDRLTTLRVSDVMRKDVVHVSAHQSMSEVAEILVSHDVSGAPVVDEYGQCVGILSASDFVKRQRRSGGNDQPTLEMQRHDLARTVTNHPHEIVRPAEDLVCHHMSTAVQSISPHAQLIDAVVIMDAQHVHRLPVLDKQGHLLGLLTSMDIIAPVITAFNEARSLESK